MITPIRLGLQHSNPFVSRFDHVIMKMFVVNDHGDGGEGVETHGLCILICAAVQLQAIVYQTESLEHVGLICNRNCTIAKWTFF